MHFSFNKDAIRNVRETEVPPREGERLLMQRICRVVLVPVERGFMAREPEEWIPPEPFRSQSREARVLAQERDRLVRSRSVAKDTLLNLPVSVPMFDGEELYRAAPPPLPQTRNYDSNREITRGYIQAPPNKTVWDSPDWRDSNPTVGKSNSCSSSSSQPRPKSSSTGQLSGWGLHWNRSGKSPPSHNRTRHHHQRHSHPSNSKNSSASSAANNNNNNNCNSTCKHKGISSPAAPTAAAALLLSSSSSSTSSSSLASACGTFNVINCPTAISAGTAISPSSSSNSPSGMFSSLGEKIQNVFSDKVNVSASCSGWSACTVPSNLSTNSSVSPKANDETKSCLLQSSRGYCDGNGKGEGRFDAKNRVCESESQQSSSSSWEHSTSHTRLLSQAQQPESHVQSSPSSTYVVIEENSSDSGGSDSCIRMKPSKTRKPSSSTSSSSPLTTLQQHYAGAVAVVVGTLSGTDNSRSGLCASDSSTTCSSTRYENLTHCSPDSHTMGRGESCGDEAEGREGGGGGELDESWERYGQDKMCSVNKSNSYRGTRPRIREQCGDIQCRLEDLNNSDPKDLHHEQDIRFDNTSGCEPLS